MHRELLINSNQLWFQLLLVEKTSSSILEFSLIEDHLYCP